PRPPAFPYTTLFRSLAIAWIHREDYARGGYRMLPSVDPLGVHTGRQAAGHALVLVPVGLLPVAIGLAGPIYFLGALALRIYYLRSEEHTSELQSTAN